MASSLKRENYFRVIYIALMILYFISSITPFWHLMPLMGLLMFILVMVYNPLKTTASLLWKNMKPVLIFSAMFLSVLVGMTYTENTEFGWTDVVLKLSFLLFALHFAMIPQGFIRKSDISIILKAFIFTVFAVSIELVIMSAWRFLETSDLNVFYYTGLVYYQHPSYIGLSVVFSIMYILHNYITNNTLYKKTTKFRYLFMMAWMVVFLFLLQSKAAILTYIFIVILALGFLIFQTRKLRMAIQSLVVLSIITIAATFLVPNSLERFSEVRKNATTPSTNNSNKESTAARVHLWKTAISVIGEKPFWGYGTGDARDVYNKKLLANGFVENNDFSYNTHSQYLQSLMTTGLPGLVSLLLLLFYPLIVAFKRKQLLYLGVVLIMMFNLLVECMFERQLGVMFFAFFNGFFFFIDREQS